MTIAEKIDALEKELAKLKEQIKADVVADYRNAYNDVSYMVASDDTIISCSLCCYPKNMYCYYHTAEYAEMAKEMKELNDKLLAFKWCYDRDYVPDWSNTRKDKYNVVYDSELNKFVPNIRFTDRYFTVCFSTQVIAQKCCDWLNGMMGDK